MLPVCQPPCILGYGTVREHWKHLELMCFLMQQQRAMSSELLHYDEWVKDIEDQASLAGDDIRDPSKRVNWLFRHCVGDNIVRAQRGEPFIVFQKRSRPVYLGIEQTQDLTPWSFFSTTQKNAAVMRRICYDARTLPPMFTYYERN